MPRRSWPVCAAFDRRHRTPHPSARHDASELGVDNTTTAVSGVEVAVVVHPVHLVCAVPGDLARIQPVIHVDTAVVVARARGEADLTLHVRRRPPRATDRVVNPVSERRPEHGCQLCLDVRASRAERHARKGGRGWRWLGWRWRGCGRGRGCHLLDDAGRPAGDGAHPRELVRAIRLSTVRGASTCHADDHRLAARIVGDQRATAIPTASAGIERRRVDRTQLSGRVEGEVGGTVRLAVARALNDSARVLEHRRRALCTGRGQAPPCDDRAGASLRRVGISGRGKAQGRRLNRFGEDEKCSIASLDRRVVARVGEHLRHRIGSGARAAYVRRSGHDAEPRRILKLARRLVHHAVACREDHILRDDRPAAESAGRSAGDRVPDLPHEIPIARSIAPADDPGNSVAGRGPSSAC
jgi:hypothetical protein